MDFQRTGFYDLVCIKTKELDLEENYWIKNNDIKHCFGKYNSCENIEELRILQNSTIDLIDKKT
jgi:hypothetical protein